MSSIKASGLSYSSGENSISETQAQGFGNSGVRPSSAVGGAQVVSTYGSPTSTLPGPLRSNSYSPGSGIGANAVHLQGRIKLNQVGGSYANMGAGGGLAGVPMLPRRAHFNPTGIVFGASLALTHPSLIPPTVCPCRVISLRR